LKFLVKLSRGESIKYLSLGSSLTNLNSLNIFLASEIAAKIRKKYLITHHISTYLPGSSKRILEYWIYFVVF